MYCCRLCNSVGDGGGTVDTSSGSRASMTITRGRCSMEDITQVGGYGDVCFGVSRGIDISLFK